MVPTDPASGRDLAFVSYSHLDREWLPRLQTLLKPYVRRGQLQLWADPYIEVGDRWEREIENALGRTRVGVLLISQHFFASDFIVEREIPPLLRDAAAEQVKLFCIPVSTVDGVLLGNLRAYKWARPPNQPLDLLSGGELNRALVEIVATLAAMFPQSPAVDTPVAAHREPVAPARAAAGTPLGALHGVPPPPPHFLQRGEAAQALKAALLDLDRPSVGVSAARGTGLHGLGGIGKTVLAAAVARDKGVRRAFRDGIYWVTLGQQPSVIGLQQDLLEAMTGERPVLESVSVGTMRLRQSLEQKNCLVVLDDAWELGPLQAFDVLGARGRLLVTTRDAQLLTAMGAHTQSLDVLAPEDARKLLAQWAGATSPLPPEASEVAQQCGNLPLALALGAAQVRDGLSWKDVRDALVRGKLEFLDHPYGSVFKSLAASVRALPEAEAARYLELGIFPEDTPVPEEVVVRLWSRAGLDAAIARKLLRKLAGRALLALVGDGEQKLVRFHDLQRDYLQIAAEDLAGTHARLLEACLETLPADDRIAARWAALPVSEGYLWRRLGYHLIGAGQTVTARTLLLDCDWLAAKLGATDIGAVIADFAPLAPSRDEPLGLVRDALLLSSHVLAVRPEELVGQLLGRMLDLENTEIRSLLTRARMSAKPPVLLPLWRRLDPPGAPIVRTIEGHEVHALAIAPDSRTCVSGSGRRSVTPAHSNGELKVWDLASGRLLRTLEGHGDVVNAVAITPDGRTCVSGSSDKTVRVWDLASGHLLRTLEGHGDSVQAVAITPDGRSFVSGSSDKTVKVWDLESGRPLRTREGHSSSVWAVAITPDGGNCVSGLEDALNVWDLASGKLVRTLRDSRSSSFVGDIAISPDGRSCIRSSGNWLNVWDLASGKLLRTLGRGSWITAVAISPDGSTCVSADSWERTLKVWDLESGELLRTFDAIDSSLVGYEGGWLKVAISPDSRTCVSGSQDGTLKVWDLRSDNLPRGEEERGGISAVAMMPDERACISASVDLKVWELTSGKLVRTIGNHGASVDTLAVTPDGRICVSGSKWWKELDTGPTLKVWDLSKGKLVRTIKHTWPAAITPDAKTSICVSIISFVRTLRVWDLASGKFLRTLEGSNSDTVAITPDGRTCVAVNERDGLKVWDLASGKLLKTFERPRGVATAVAITPDGGTCVVGYQTFADPLEPRSLKVWDLASGKLLHTLHHGADFISSIAIAHDGRICISPSKNRMIKVWDLASGKLLAGFTGDFDIRYVSAAPNGNRLVAGESFGRVHLFEIILGTNRIHR